MEQELPIVPPSDDFLILEAFEDRLDLAAARKAAAEFEASGEAAQPIESVAAGLGIQLPLR